MEDFIDEDQEERVGYGAMAVGAGGGMVVDGGAMVVDSRDPDRIFCPRCFNMWSPWEDRRLKTLMLKCNRCGYMEQADHTKPVHENYVVKQMKNILDNVSPAMGEDPTLHENAKSCSSCGGTQGVHFQADTGAKAESLKLVFVCKICGNKWMES
uniref:DNA-directed RNA polymerase II subunit RPB9-like zinc ribbon domain-containing protein n=1 Tax=Rhizochromulina marina TaxID=1034831 RepID=A0A7S2WTG1_9STRA|mmetsp:Transcript_32894/g.95194  ORF Transcript_32894/g.95194 Transcript_32894/m.95194 type:complete len:154 (+) Transcript_32894:66-527(+)